MENALVVVVALVGSGSQFSQPFLARGDASTAASKTRRKEEYMMYEKKRMDDPKVKTSQ